MSEKKSFAKLTQLPDKFWEALIIFAFVILISPFLSGMDFGVVKVPQFSPFWNAILFPIGICLFTLTALAFYPFFGSSVKNNIYWAITVILALLVITEILVLYFFPTIKIMLVEVDYISPRGVAHLKVKGDSKKLVSNDFKIFVFTRVPKNEPLWWYDPVANTGFDPVDGKWEAEAIVGSNDEGRRICHPTEVEVIAIASTDEEMKKEFAKNTDSTPYIKYFNKFNTYSEKTTLTVTPKTIPVCCVNDKDPECAPK